MKAARFHGDRPQLTVEDVADPVLEPGCAIIEVEAAFVTATIANYLANPGARMLPPFPFVPGMDTVGRVVAVADDVSGLEPGTRVYCDHWYASHNVSAEPDHCFLGYFGMAPGAMRHMRRWPNGAYAQKMILPAECMTPLGKAADKATAAQLCRLGWFGTAYGALVKARLKPAETVIVNGGTGMVGSSGVMIALAMGAVRVVALGRRRDTLEKLASLAPGRIVPVALTGGPGDAAAIAEAAPGGAEVVLDAVGTGAAPWSTQAAIDALAFGGRAVLVGSGLSGPLALDYTRIMYREATVQGSVWFPRKAAAEMIAMVAAGTLELSAIAPETVPLERVNEAIRAANSRSMGLGHFAVAP
jgi:alcohol dehydrogenase